MINKIVYYFVAVFRHRFITEDAIDYATTCVDGSVLALLALEAGWRAGAGAGGMAHEYADWSDIPTSAVYRVETLN